jgi:predicted RNA-binding Zn-ribbon protein involved in translation (DUF1610 family)
MAPEIFKKEKEFNCPQCGDTLSLYFKHTKLIQCASCKSTIFLEDEAVHLSGERSVLAPEMSILTLNTPFFYQEKRYLPLGKIRYSYGRGFWEEWWIKGQEDKYWLSVDEGDLVLQQRVDVDYPNDFFSKLHVGLHTRDDWVVTELGEARCDGFAGSLPKRVSIGSTYHYAHLSGKNARLRTLEFFDDALEAYEGMWLSPFDIRGTF